MGHSDPPPRFVVFQAYATKKGLPPARGGEGSEESSVRSAANTPSLSLDPPPLSPFCFGHRSTLKTLSDAFLLPVHTNESGAVTSKSQETRGGRKEAFSFLASLACLNSRLFGVGWFVRSSVAQRGTRILHYRGMPALATSTSDATTAETPQQRQGRRRTKPPTLSTGSTEVTHDLFT